MKTDYQITIKEGVDCSLEEILSSLKEEGGITRFYRFKTGHYSVSSETPEFMIRFEGIECVESIIESPEYKAIDLTSQTQESNNN